LVAVIVSTAAATPIQHAKLVYDQLRILGERLDRNIAKLRLDTLEESLIRFAVGEFPMLKINFAIFGHGVIDRQQLACFGLAF
jgi:hypothetical protein